MTIKTVIMNTKSNRQDSSCIQESLQELLVLETYPSQDSAYDGLSGLFNEVKDVGAVVADTSDMCGAKVLVCGIAPLYEQKISPLNTNVVFTTFESDKLPKEWVISINKYNHCIVAHSEVKKTFIASGVHVPITVIHNGYRRYRRSNEVYAGNTSFNVGFLGIPVNRKNLHKLYIACKHLQQTLIPELQLHVHVASFYDWLNPASFAEMRSDAMVRWTMGKYSAEQIAAWYHHLSCYIFPSSGEGWSYTPRESMYLGIPTIISDIPVHKELSQSGFYEVIKAAGREPADFNGAVHGYWDYIDVEDIMRAITNVYQRKIHFYALAQQGAVWIENKWQNKDIGRMILDLMKTF